MFSWVARHINWLQRKISKFCLSKEHSSLRPFSANVDPMATVYSRYSGWIAMFISLPSSTWVYCGDWLLDPEINSHMSIGMTLQLVCSVTVPPSQEFLTFRSVLLMLRLSWPSGQYGFSLNSDKGVTIGGGALNFPFSRAKISFGVLVRSENLSGYALSSRGLRRLINPGWVIPCINLEILMHSEPLLRPGLHALVSFHEVFRRFSVSLLDVMYLHRILDVLLLWKIVSLTLCS
ncbi:hypothetical protein Tco_0456061 [Tanacetum coccineum]